MDELRMRRVQNRAYLHSPISICEEMVAAVAMIVYGWAVNSILGWINTKYIFIFTSFIGQSVHMVVSNRNVGVWHSRTAYLNVIPATYIHR